MKKQIFSQEILIWMFVAQAIGHAVLGTCGQHRCAPKGEASRNDTLFLSVFCGLKKEAKFLLLL
jgi:hypothetical protein